MKTSALLLLLFLLGSCAKGKEKNYTASTPANGVVKAFLGIPQSDSVDFIRWKLTLLDNRYRLFCNYGIGKNNTNGFINGGVKIEINGDYRQENNYLQFRNGNKTLDMVELNADLLHLLDADKNLLVGNGGWSYTLNVIGPAGSDKVSIMAGPAGIRDSAAYEGRTPCQVPGVVEPGSQCYKLKWLIKLYTRDGNPQAGQYRILGTVWRDQGGKTGSWKIMKGGSGQTIYRLNDDRGNGFLYLLKLDERVLIFTDVGGKLLVGDEDFSYTLNRRW